MQVEIKNFRPQASGSLVGHADVLLPQISIKLNGCSVFKSGDREWVNLPQRTWKDPEGKTKYSNQVEMPLEMQKDFSSSVLESLKTYVKIDERNVKVVEHPKTDMVDDFPF